MGRGGKKKNKPVDKEPPPPESQPSTSKEASTSQETPTSQEPSTSQETTRDVRESSIATTASTDSSKKEIPEDKTVKMQDDEEEVGMGLGLGTSKKRPRKKKKAATPSEASTASLTTLPEKKEDKDVQELTEELSGLTAAGPSEAFPKLAGGLGSGRGRGRGRGAPPPQSQVQPIPLAPKQQVPVAKTQPLPWGGQPSVQLHPTPIQQQQPPQPAPAATFSQTGASGYGRGSGRSQAKTVQSVVTPGPVACRFNIPTKIPAGIVTRQSEPIKLLTNYLEMRIKPIKIFRYDVAIKPEKPRKFGPKAFAVTKERHFPKHVIAFDQRKNCFTLKRLFEETEERKTYRVDILDDNNQKMSFEVIIKFTGIVDLEKIINHMKAGGSSLNPPTEAIQAVDVILQQGTLEKYVRVGRQYFTRPSNPYDLYYGMEMWTGLFQSAIFTSRAFINIDVAHKAFPRQQNLIEAIVKDFQMDPSYALERQRGVDYFQQFIKGLKVRARMGGGQKIREFICNDIVDPARTLTFSTTDSAGVPKMVTVEKYFAVDKGYRLRYPNLNCMWVGPRDKSIFYPMELLDISYGQPCNRQLNEKQLQTIVTKAATSPDYRLQKIRNVIRDVNYPGNECFKNFQMEVSDKFYQVNAKILPSPELDLGMGKPVDTRRGVWQANRFQKPVMLDSWAMITVEADPNACQCQKLIDMIKRIGSQMGMMVRDPLMTNFSVRITELKRILSLASDKRVNMLIVIVTGRYKDAYEKVKRLAELEVGILTQCIKENTARRMSDQTVRNILLKVNSKLMGVNQILTPRSTPECIKNGGVMMVGADVTHPSPDQRSIPSIAAVTASIDAKCFSYNLEMSIQTPKLEIIADFEEMMFDHFKVYKSRMNSLPRKIYVFRDGVSEGQFAQVMNSELVAIQNAYSRLEQRVKPEILFLLVQKRHHTRFFLNEKSSDNVRPGTVVDCDIVHPRELDFYLVSHQAIKGTARPTRYHVVSNDGKIPSDEIEQLAYYLCHLYSRCARAVSYPAPTYYAHLACLRARTLTSGVQYDNNQLERGPQRLRILDRILEYSRMFFV